MNAKTPARALCAAIACLFIVASPNAQRPERPPRPSPETLPEIAEKILRQPALSPDDKTLAFVYDGDIWTVPTSGGEARRLTVTPGNEGSPIFSPDGRWLAFRSRRFGGDHIYIMPSAGGEARRLTFADAAEDPCCWLPDGSGLIFSSGDRGRGRDLWVVRLEGGEPWPITDGGYGENEGQASISPDGKRIAYTRRPMNPFYRRAYLGTANSEIWLCDFDGLATSNHRPLTTSRAHNSYPRFLDNSTVVYATFDDGKGGAAKQSRLAAINLKGEPATSPNWENLPRFDAREISRGNRMIAFSTGSYGGWKLHVVELTRNLPTKVHVPAISVRTDRREADVRVFKHTRAEEFKLSPDGKKLAFTAGADVYVMPAEEGGVPRRVTDGIGREKDINWAPDSRRLVYASESLGSHHLRGGPMFDYHVRIADLATGEVKGIRGDGGPETHPHVLTDGQSILYLRGNSHVKRFDPSGHYPSSQKGDFSAAVHAKGNYFDLSPDTEWMVYTLRDNSFNSAVYISATAFGVARKLATLHGECYQPRFSRDGKRVDFICNLGDGFDVYSVDLVASPLEFKEDKLDRLFEEKEKKAEPGEEGKPVRPDPKAAKAPPKTVIDFEGLQKRVRRVTSLEGNESWPLSVDDGKTFYFVANVQRQSNIWKLTVDPDKGPDLKQLTQTRGAKSHLTISADEKTLWFLDGGVITGLNIASGKTTACPFSIEQRRHAREMRNQIFHEVVVTMADLFYQGGMHGVDWRKTAERYRQALDATATGDEFGGLVNELLGELNSSHQGFSPEDEREDGMGETVGQIGLDFDPAGLAEGVYRVLTVLPGGPCDQKTVVPPTAEGRSPTFEPRVKPGDYLVGVNGKALARPGVLARELLDSTGRKTVLRFNSKPEFSGGHDLAVKPATRREISPLIYEHWVEQRRQLVKKLSNGQLGYAHVRSMNTASVAEFRQQLADGARGARGLVIDVRFNGGGWTAVDLLEILIKRPWLERRDRNNRVSENIYRSVALEKPSCLLINQGSFSNAEILAEGYRKLGIGKIIGVDTAGGVIGTGGMRLSDGSSLRVPGMGAFSLEGENLELAGRKPDIYVPNDINAVDRGEDPQLEAAVKALLEDLKRG